MYVPPCVCSSSVSTSVCMSLHVNSPPYVCPHCVCSSGVCSSVCIHSCVYPSVYMTHHVNFPFVCTYVPSMCMFFCLIVPSCVSRLHVYIPPFVNLFVCISLHVYAPLCDCPSVCMSPPLVHDPSVFMSLRMFVSSCMSPGYV